MTTGYDTGVDVRRGIWDLEALASGRGATRGKPLNLPVEGRRNTAVVAGVKLSGKYSGGLI